MNTRSEYSKIWKNYMQEKCLGVCPCVRLVPGKFKQLNLENASNDQAEISRTAFQIDI